jgi:hypothetical protein
MSTMGGTFLGKKHEDTKERKHEDTKERRNDSFVWKVRLIGPLDAGRVSDNNNGIGLTIKPENVYFRCVKNGKMHRKGLHPFIRSCKKQTIATLFGSKPTRINQVSFKYLKR